LTANAGAPVYAWVPLGWGDPFQPWWRGCSQACWTHYNRHFAVGNAARPGMPPDRYAHVNVPGALTAVAGATLVDRKPVPGNRVHVPATQLASAPALTGAPTVTPGQGHAPVFRPGERGTPVPASTLYGDARRHRSPAPGGPVTPSRQTGATPPAQVGGVAGAPNGPATRQRPAPTTAPTTPPPAAPVPGVAATAPGGLKTVAPFPGPAKPAVAIDGNAASAPAAPLEGQPTKRHHAGPDVPAGSAGRPVSSPSPSPGAAGVAMPATMAPVVKAAPAPLPSPQPAAPAPGAVSGTPVERGHAAAAKAAADADAAKAKAADRNAAGAQGQAPAPR
jgi:hypothetical protein